MWIERIEFTGFGNIRDKRVDLTRDCLNLVVEPNGFGKSTMAEAIWAILFDYQSHQRTTEERLKEREVRRPFGGGPFKASLDLSAGQRRFRVVRDFGEKSIRIFDLANADLEVSDEFVHGPNEDEFGFRMTGMGRDVFRSTCFVGQRDLDVNSFGGNTDLAALMQGLADSGDGAMTSAEAILVLESALSQFQFEGRKCRVDTHLKELKEQRDDLEGALAELEEERTSAGNDLKQLTSIEENLADLEAESESIKYFQLCLTLADLDSRLQQSEERINRLNDLKRDLDALGSVAEFPAELEKEMESLWTKRQSRLNDLTRLQDQFDSKEKQLKERDLEVREKWHGLTEFNADDAQAVVTLATTMKDIMSELKEARSKRDAEAERVKEEGANLSELEGVRKALLNLEARDMDDANAYGAMIKSARDTIKECENTVWRARQVANNIEEDQKGNKKRKLMLVMMGSVIWLMLAAVSGLMIHTKGFSLNSVKESELGVPLALTAALALFLFFQFVAFLRSGSHRANELKKARDEEEEYAAKGQEMHVKVQGLEVKMEDLARKAGVSSGSELASLIESYSKESSQLKDLDLLEQLVDGREIHLSRLKAELEAYFSKANRSTDNLTPEEGLKLAEEINRCIEDMHSLKSSEGLLESREPEMKFLDDELKVIEGLLKEIFTKGRADDPSDLQASYDSFTTRLESFRKREDILKELTRLEQDSAFDYPSSELPEAIERLNSDREITLSSMKALLEKYPDIADRPPRDAGGAELNARSAELEARLRELRRDRENCTVAVRAATSDYDDNFLRIQEELEEVDKSIQAISEAKAALSLAVDTFKKLSSETHAHWSMKLNETTKQMLEKVDSDYESLSFDQELRLTARRKGMSEPLQTNNINSHLSCGTREQLHLLSRLAVSRYLSSGAQLPIIMDEPFAQADDETFLTMMRFLIEDILPSHQVVLFTCHETRHRWLTDKLSDEERGLIQYCRLDPVEVVSA